MINKKYLIYHLRWQLSGFVIAPCIFFLNGNAILSSLLGNFLGAVLFWFFDKWLFSKKNSKGLTSKNK